MKPRLSNPRHFYSREEDTKIIELLVTCNGDVHAVYEEMKKVESFSINLPKMKNFKDHISRCIGFDDDSGQVAQRPDDDLLIQFEHYYISNYKKQKLSQKLMHNVFPSISKTECYNAIRRIKRKLNKAPNYFTVFNDNEPEEVNSFEEFITESPEEGW